MGEQRTPRSVAPTASAATVAAPSVRTDPDSELTTPATARPAHRLDQSRRQGHAQGVTVVIPAYNEEKYLADCLTSLLAQTYPQRLTEIIVADNGSTDGTAEVARRFGVRVVSEPRKGAAYARQAGFMAASHELVAGIDADCVAPPDWLARIVGEFEDTPGLVGLSGRSDLFGAAARFDRFWMRHVNTLFLWFNYMIHRPLFNGMNFAVRRSAFQAIGGFATHLRSAEDMELSLRLKSRGKVHFRMSLWVHSSARRVREGRARILRHALYDYFSLVWFKGEPEGFSDIR